MPRELDCRRGRRRCLTSIDRRHGRVQRVRKPATETGVRAFRLRCRIDRE